MSGRRNSRSNDDVKIHKMIFVTNEDTVYVRIPVLLSYEEASLSLSFEGWFVECLNSFVCQ
jgi:hypothetical protein